MEKTSSFVIISAVIILSLFTIFCYLMSNVNPSQIPDSARITGAKLDVISSNTTKNFRKMADNHIKVGKGLTTKTLNSSRFYKNVMFSEKIVSSTVSAKGFRGSIDDEKFVILKILDDTGESKLQIKVIGNAQRKSKIKKQPKFSITFDNGNERFRSILPKNSIIKILRNDTIIFREIEDTEVNTINKEIKKPDEIFEMITNNNIINVTVANSDNKYSVTEITNHENETLSMLPNETFNTFRTKNFSIFENYYSTNSINITNQYEVNRHTDNIENRKTLSNEMSITQSTSLRDIIADVDSQTEELTKISESNFSSFITVTRNNDDSSYSTGSILFQ